MTESRPPVERWLRRVALMLVVCMLVLGCVVIWRLAVVVYRVEQSVVHVTQQVNQVASRMSAQVDRLADQLEELEQRTTQALPIEETYRLLDELAVLRSTLHEPPQPLTDAAEAEIKHMLKAIRTSGHTFGYGRITLNAWLFHRSLDAKYRAYGPTIDAAENFIERIATTTMVGQRYYVQIDGEERIWLDDWLRDILQQHRNQQPTP